MPMLPVPCAVYNAVFVVVTPLTVAVTVVCCHVVDPIVTGAKGLTTTTFVAPAPWTI